MDLRGHGTEGGKRSPFSPLGPVPCNTWLGWTKYSHLYFSSITSWNLVFLCFMSVDTMWMATFRCGKRFVRSRHTFACWPRRSGSASGLITKAGRTWWGPPVHCWLKAPHPASSPRTKWTVPTSRTRAKRKSCLKRYLKQPCESPKAV